MALQRKQVYEFGEFRLWPRTRVLERTDAPVALNRRAFDVLLYLVQNPGRLISKEELLKNVWDDAFVDENNLTQSISSLRRALNEKPGANAFIATVPGQGYQFLSRVELRPEPGPEVPSIDAPAGTETQGLLVLQQRTVTTTVETEERRSSWAWITVVAGVLLVAGLAVGGLWEWNHRVVPGDHHEVVLADFQNTTGEADFSEPLKTAVDIDLRQSPYLSIASDVKVAQTLKMMEKPEGNPLTPALAREVCQRINDQAVLNATIARFGSKYLVTLTASDCASGNVLVQSRQTAGNRDEVLQAVDSVAADMRKRLGEPLKSLRLYSQPVVLSKETGSLEALKVYTQAHDQGMAGKFLAAIPLFQRAIELDPKFAAAYADLAAVYTNLGESGLATQNFTKAYELRDFTDEKDRLFIVAAYNQRVTGDLNATIGNLETWTELYPDATSAWANMASAYVEEGQYEKARVAAQHAVTLDPDAPFGYILLATAQMALGQVDAAKATCGAALTHKLDIAQIHGLLFRAGALQHDDAAMATQWAWAKGTNAEPYMQLQEALYDLAIGQAAEGRKLLGDLVDGYRKQGQQERATRMLGALPRLLVYMGEVDAAKEALQTLPPVDGSTDIPVAKAEVGDVSGANAELQQELHKHPNDTLWQYFRGPQIAAAIALANKQPGAAVEALKVSSQYEARNSEIPSLRGQAYLALNQPQAAIAEFHKVIDHPGIEPLTPNLALAHLGIARALALEGNHAASRSEFEQFFACWKHGDANLPALVQARLEYAAQQ